MYIEVILDMTNKNALISTAMFNTISNGKYLDNIDLIRPFAIYVLGRRFRVNEIINNEKVIEDLENEFGLKGIPNLVINKILLRIAKVDKALKEQVLNGKKVYKVKRELEILFIDISKNRTDATKKINNIIEKLNKFLIDKTKRELNNEVVERFLINFLEEKGLETLKCSAIKLDNNQINFFIGNFILNIKESDEELFNDFLDITTGYMISNVIYYEVNNDGEKLDFSNVDFYIDTRLLLGMLQFKTETYNVNCDMLRKMILKKGGNLKCFSHNFREVESILEGYKHSISSLNNDRIYTLEYFDDNNYSAMDVDTIISLLESKLNSINISVVDTPLYLKDEYEHVIDEPGLRECLVANINYMNKDGQSPDNDVKSISAIHRIRKGCNCNKLVSCKAFLITDNYQLARAGNKFIKNFQIKYKYSLIMEDVDLATIIWLFDSSLAKDYPKKKLIENAMATQKISKSVREEFLKCIDKLEAHGGITELEAAKLRSDRYMANKVMELSHGDSDEVDESLILRVKELYETEIINQKFKEQLQSNDEILKSKDFENEQLRRQLEEKNKQLLEFQKLQEEEHNKEIIEDNKRITDSATQKRNKVEKNWRVIINFIIILIMFTFIYPLFYDFILVDNSKEFTMIDGIRLSGGIITALFSYITIRDKNVVIEKFIKSMGTKAYEQEIIRYCPSILESAMDKDKEVI